MRKPVKKTKSRVKTSVASAGRKVAPERTKELFAEDEAHPSTGKKVRLARNPMATAYR